MRYRIEKSPRDGSAITVENDASGTNGVAHRSTGAVESVGENGEPTKITPTHWHPVARDQYRLREDERSLLAASSTTVILGAATLIVTYFSADVATYMTRYAGHEVMHIAGQENRLANQGSRRGNLVAQRQVEPDQANAPSEAQQAAQEQHIALSVREAQQSLMEDRAEGRAQEPTQTRHTIEGLAVQQQAEAAKSARSLEEERERAASLAQEAAAARQTMTANAEQQRRTLDETQTRAAALASELAGTPREIEARATQSKAVDDAVQQKQTAEGAVADLQRLLQQEQKKTAALTQEVGAARQAMTANAEQQRRALDEAQARAAALASELAGRRREIEAQSTQLHKAVDEAVWQKQTAKGTVADLQQLLQRDGDRIEAMAWDLTSAPRMMDARGASGRSADGIHAAQVVKTAVTQTAVTQTAAMEPPKAAEAQGSAESAKLVTRAKVLLGQGNIVAARIVLEPAAESGNAQASFMLAETYDPVILSAWGTYGTRGEAAKAREHYAKAQSGGIPEAKDRLDALGR